MRPSSERMYTEQKKKNKTQQQQQLENDWSSRNNSCFPITVTASFPKL